MPIITLAQPDMPVAQFSVSGNQITVDGLTVDCSAEQTDSQNVIEIRLIGGAPQIGETGPYLAVITIPPKTYSEIETGETDQDTGINIVDIVTEDLDPNTVHLTLWPIA